jgi:hypothetical protein
MRVAEDVWGDVHSAKYLFGINGLQLHRCSPFLFLEFENAFLELKRMDSSMTCSYQKAFSSR